MTAQPATPTVSSATGPTTGRPAPVADWITIPELYTDPFPSFERLRAEARGPSETSADAAKSGPVEAF